jgi:hypothetical protein
MFEDTLMNSGKKEIIGEQVITYNQILPDCNPVKCIDLGKPEIGPTTCNSGFCVQDVVQGALRNCYLMAGLASVAFASPVTMSTKYQAMAGSLPNKKIPVNSNNVPCYGNIGPRNVIWPLIYERAYAKQKGCDPCANPDGPVRPTCIEGGAGLKGLQDITGWKSVLLQISSFQPSQILNSNGFASVPAVAWTTAGDPGNKIYNDHTYSYLGHTSDGFVVLRNPHGALVDNPSNPQIVKLSGPWTPNCCLNVNFASPAPYGIFGLKLDYFKSKFSGIGYVTQR